GREIGSVFAAKCLLHGCLDRFVGDESELDAGGPTRWWSRSLRGLRPEGTSSHWPAGICDDGNTGNTRVLVAPQPKRISLRSVTGNYVEVASSAAADHGTLGDEEDFDRDSNAACFRALLLAFSDHDLLKNHAVQRAVATWSS